MADTPHVRPRHLRPGTAPSRHVLDDQLPFPGRRYGVPGQAEGLLADEGGKAMSSDIGWGADREDVGWGFMH